VELEPGFTIHSVCAFEKDNTVELYTTAWECAAIASGSVKGNLFVLSFYLFFPSCCAQRKIYIEQYVPEINNISSTKLSILIQ
jgi:hypothetical protein